jgi:hypothetical protein
MIIIWRSWGWLVLPFFLAVWGLADGPVSAIYRTATDDMSLYNAEKGVCWAIAFFVIALPLGALGFWRRHAERTRTPEESTLEDAKRREQLAQWEAMRIKDGQAPDPQTQAILAGTSPLPALTRTRSSFFFIPFWVFGFVFVALGALVLVINLPEALELAR